MVVLWQHHSLLSLCAFCTFRVHVWVKSCRTCLSVPGSFHTFRATLVHSRLSQIRLFVAGSYSSYILFINSCADTLRLLPFPGCCEWCRKPGSDEPGGRAVCDFWGTSLLSDGSIVTEGRWHLRFVISHLVMLSNLMNPLYICFEKCLFWSAHF